MRRPILVAAALAALCAAPANAHAHLVQTGCGSFYDGVAHLAVTPGDVLVVVGLGLLAGLCGAATSRRVLVAVPVAWLAGGAVGHVWPGAPAMAWMTTATVVMAGGLVAWGRAWPRPAVVAFACAAALLHGAADGASMREAGMPFLALVGTAVATFVAVTLLPAVVLSLRADWTKIAVRVAGSWVAAIGILMLGWLTRA